MIPLPGAFLAVSGSTGRIMVYNGQMVTCHMAKVYDVPPDALISKLAEYLKESDIVEPEWTAFVKTGAHADRPPNQRDWWYVRCASILRKIYLQGPIGINQMRKIYGGGRPSGYGAAHHRKAGGAVIRSAVHSLESLGLVEKVGNKGRAITPMGMKHLDNVATMILKDMIKTAPALKIYR